MKVKAVVIVSLSQLNVFDNAIACFYIYIYIYIFFYIYIFVIIVESERKVQMMRTIEM